MDGQQLMTWLLAIGATIVLVYFHRRIRGGRRIPGPPGHPIIGHLLQILQPNFHRILSDWSEKYGGVYSISILGLQGVVVSDPEAIAQVLGRDKGIAEVPKHLASYSQLNLLWGGVHQHSMFTGPTSETWRLVRRAVSPCFSSANIRGKFGIVWEKCVTLSRGIQALGAHHALDMDEAGMRLTLDIVAQAAFQYDTHAVDFTKNAVITALPCALKELQKRMTNPFQAYISTEESRQALQCANEFKLVCCEILSSLRSRSMQHEDDMSVGVQLLRIRDPATGRPLPDAQLLAEIGTFLMGGFETTAHTLSFTLFCIASHPDIQQKIADELQTAGLLPLGGHRSARDLQYDDLHQLRYLDSVLKEAMRMFPVVAGFPRVTEKKTQIGQYTVAKGTFVYVLFHSLHNSPMYWEKPAAFCPERWQEKGAQYVQISGQPATDSQHIDRASFGNESKDALKRFLPFSDGPRSCIAQAMAMMELKTALAVLCTRFHFHPAARMGGIQGLQALETMALTLHIRGGIHIHCEPRQAI